jgi:nucleoside-diphosphate-sugar epimerase
MERIVVTGHQGFIGRALVAELLKRRYIVLPIGRDFTELKCDRVYHLASPSTTERIVANPLAVMDTIMDVTRSALKICPTALFINASSKGADELVDSAQGCYNVAKRCMEQYVQYSGVEFINYRIPSVYGPGMHNSNFIKRCVDGNATVPTTPDKLHYIAHIDDVVDAMINLTPIQTEEITLGEIYEDFSSGWRGIYRPTFGSQATK